MGAGIGSALGRATMPGATWGTVGQAGLNGYGLASGYEGAKSLAGKLLAPKVSQTAVSDIGGSAMLPKGPTDPSLTMSNGLSSSDALASIPTQAYGAAGIPLPTAPVPPALTMSNGQSSYDALKGLGGLEDAGDALTAPVRRGPAIPLQNGMSGGVNTPLPRLDIPTQGRSFLDKLGSVGSKGLDLAEKYPKAVSGLLSGFGPEAEYARARTKQLEQEMALAEARNRALEPLRALLAQQIPGTFTGRAPTPTVNPYIR